MSDAAGAAGRSAGDNGALQLPQYRAPSGSSLPQLGQISVVVTFPAVRATGCSAGANGAPQVPQNREPSGSSLPQFPQVVMRQAWPQLVQKRPSGRRSAPQFSQ